MGAIGIRVVAWGAHGGAAANPSAGGYVDVTLDASQLIGPDLTVFVGQDGQQTVGGNGNTVGNGGAGPSFGWGGGAATYVKDSTGTYLVIGGGGGGDSAPVRGNPVPKGGPGGGNSGNGVAGQNGVLNIATGGAGGSQVAGGAGGSPGGSAGGSLATGINMGGTGSAIGQPGGGGGGFYGGGGTFSPPIIVGGGGGGGSNYYDAAKTLILDANTSDLRAEANGFVFITAIFAPCVAEGTKVRLETGEQRLIQNLKKGDLLAGNIPLEALIKFTTPARHFIRIPGNDRNSEALLIRRGHPILVNGKEVLPEALIGQMGIVGISTEKPTTIYTLITHKKEFVEMQNHLFVATWSKESWEINAAQERYTMSFQTF